MTTPGSAEPGANADGVELPEPVVNFDVASGAPFNALQERLGLIGAQHRQIGLRVFVFIFIAWGIPLLLAILGGPGASLDAAKLYLSEISIWARYVLAIGLFIIMEVSAASQLRNLVRQFFYAPVLSREAFSPAARAVADTLRAFDSRLAEIISLIAAAGVSWVLYTRMLSAEGDTWARMVDGGGTTITLAGWWVIVISNPLFTFLLLRWLWRFLVWCRLLKRLSTLELRTVSTHPDGQGGIGFVGAYPNAFVLFVLAISFVIGSVLANQVLQTGLETTVYASVMTLWLVLVLIVFSIPLMFFNEPLATLKQETLIQYNALATRHFREVERSQLGENITAKSDQPEANEETSDPTKTLQGVAKQSGTLVNFKKLLPVQLAALVPLVIAGSAYLPFKELLGLLKKILFF